MSCASIRSTTTRSDPPYLAQGQAGRADLLHLLAALGEDGLAYAAPLLGYRRERSDARDESPPMAVPALQSLRTEPPAEPPAAPRLTRYWALENQESISEQAAAVVPPNWYPERPQDTAHPDYKLWQAMDQDRPPGGEWHVPTWQPLLPWSRLGAWLRRRLGDTRPGREPDVARLLDLVAAARPLRRIPMKPRRGWLPRIAVLLGHAEHLGAYREDINDVWRRLVRERGKACIDAHVLEAMAGNGGLEVRSAGVLHGRRRPWAMPTPGVPLLVLGDLGILAGEPEMYEGWMHFGRSLRRAGVDTVALCPVPSGRVPAVLAHCYEVHEWERSARLSRPFSPGSGESARSGGTDDLRARLAPFLRVEPALLRALRRGTGIHAVAEADLYRDPEIRGDGCNLCWVGPGDNPKREREFVALPLTEQGRVADLIARFHGGTPSQAMTEYGLIGHYTRSLPPAERDTVLRPEKRRELDDYRARLARWCRESQSSFLLRYWLPYNIDSQGGGFWPKSRNCMLFGLR